MKKFMLATCLFSFAAAGLFAQNATQGTKIEGYSMASPAEMAKSETDKLNSTIQLTPDQYNKILEINKQFFTQPKASTGSTTPVQLANDRDSKIKALLTSAQLVKLQKAQTK